MNLDQVTSHSERLAETVEFFEKLGLRRIVDSLPRYARLECPDGESTLSVNIADHVRPNEGITLYFECEDLDREVERLKSRGLASMKIPETAPGSGAKPI